MKVNCSHTGIQKISELKPNPKNPNKHPDSQIELLAKIIETQGWRSPIVVSKRSGMIVKGHGRFEAAVKLGLKEVPVDLQDYASDELETADMIADNRLSELAEISKKELNSLLEALNDGEFDMELTGFHAIDIEKLIAEVGGKKGKTDKDAVPEAPETPTSKLGQIWKLGDHRLMCGDSTSSKDVRKLMGDEKADMVFTDPPWNVNYGAVKKGNAQGYRVRTIKNDSMKTDDFKGFMDKTFRCMAEISKPGCMTYIVMSPQEWGNMMLTLTGNAYHWSSTIIWNKSHAVLSRKDYHTKYEPIWYGWLDGGPRLCPLKDRKQNDVWDIDRPTKSDLHPTTKPVDLVEKAMENSSKSREVVLDLFMGSGTTMIASEILSRKCYGMELDPIYVSVIIERWQAFTGRVAILVETGETYNELKNASN